MSDEKRNSKDHNLSHVESVPYSSDHNDGGHIVVHGTAEEVDDAKRFISEEHDFTDAEYKKLRRKFDMVLMPLLMFSYGIQFTDKQSLAQGVVFGLREDTKLVGNQYANLTVFFYLAYAVAQFPMSWVLQRFPLGKALSFFIILWGGMVMLLAACHNYAQLAGVRTLLGWFESVITPGFAILTTSWYLREEQTLRQGMYYSMNTMSNIVFGILVYLLAKRSQDDGKIAPWRAINLFLGAMTILCGVVNGIFLGTPQEVWWLSKREKEMAHARIVRNATGGGEQHPWKWEQVRECFRDPQYWLFFFFNIMATIPNGAITTFNNLVYTSFGFTNFESIIWNLPTQAIAFSLVIGPALCVHFFPRSRFPVAIVILLIVTASFLGTGLAPPGTDKWTRWAVYLFSNSFAGSMFLIWPLMSINVAGRTKKAWLSATSLMTYCVGNMVGSQTFRPNDAPRYIRGLTGCSVVMLVNCVLLFCWMLYYKLENRRRDRLFAASGMSVEEQDYERKLAGETDMTDFENIHFRYSW